MDTNDVLRNVYLNMYACNHALVVHKPTHYVHVYLYQYITLKGTVTMEFPNKANHYEYLTKLRPLCSPGDWRVGMLCFFPFTCIDDRIIMM